MLSGHPGCRKGLYNWRLSDRGKYTSGDDLPRTPPGHNTGNEDLFRIVGDVRANPVDGTSKVAISTTDDVELLHIFAYCAQDLREGSVN